jgi:hypothetical protein
MQLNELPAEGQPKPCTLGLLLGTADLTELLEHRLPGNTSAFVAAGEAGEASGIANADDSSCDVNHT